MARIIVINSSSHGNSYAIETTDGILLLEAGVNITRVLGSIGYQGHKVLGCIISHEHSDHCRHWYDYSMMGIKLYSGCSPEVHPDNFHHIPRRQWTRVGNFKVYPFQVPHDVSNYGYIIEHPEFGRIFFATDTYAIGIKFKGIDHYLIEANYDDALLRESNAANSLKERVMVSHQSIDYTIKYLKDCDAEKAKTITLIHLSSKHSNAEDFKRRVQAEFGVPTYIADKGVIIDL